MQANEYQQEARRTIRINWEHRNGSDIAVLGVIGELGSLASVIKKHQRDGEAYADFHDHFHEELGDVLWYVTTVATRLEVAFSSWPDSSGVKDLFEGIYSLHENIVEITGERRALRKPKDINSASYELLINKTLQNLQGLATLMGTNLSIIAKSSCDKILSYWCRFDGSPARTFDTEFPSYEKLPRKFTIDFRGIDNGSSLIIMMNGLAIGDRLTDNSYVDDGYRFHDVFHLAGAVTLGWSPVFRRMLKLKRKSNPEVDEIEDGARAAIIEEAVINHIYDYARPNYLEGMERIDLDLIKRIQNLVQGYEVSACEPWEWQDCIIKSYEVFRALRKNKGGRLILDAEKRSITYQKLPLLVD